MSGIKSFCAFCSEKFEWLVDLNMDVVAEYAPRFLARQPRALAVMTWLMFSVFWICVAGPITLVVEALTFPWWMWSEHVGNSFGERVCNLLIACMGMLVYFVMARFIGCACAFQTGIWERDLDLV